MPHFATVQLFHGAAQIGATTTDGAGLQGSHHAVDWGAEWVRIGLGEVALPRVVFATDYPQAVDEDEHVAGYVEAVRTIGPNACAMLEGMNAEKLIPNLRDRLRN